MCLVAALALGIEPMQRLANETINGGTLRGVERCLGYSQSELLSKDAVKATCIQSFHRPLYLYDLASGEAGPRIEKESVGWGGTLDNKTSDHVTTWIRVAVTFFDAKGSKQEFYGETSIWIDPLGKAEFKVDLPELERKKVEGSEFCELDDDDPKSCMAWGITDVKGLAI